MFAYVNLIGFVLIPSIQYLHKGDHLCWLIYIKNTRIFLCFIYFRYVIVDQILEDSFLFDLPSFQYLRAC